ncbi:MAG: RNA polymerase sigma factor [Solirubrobacteraceae bacterium]
MSSAPTAVGTVVERDDRQLMTRIEAGSVDAFEQLYDRYSSRAYWMARSICRDDGRAEEAVQEAFTSIWRNRAGYRPQRGTAAAWLLAIARNRAIDIARRNGNHASRRAGEEVIERLHAAGDVAEQAVELADAAGLRSRLAGLPDAQQEVIALAFYGQLTHSEIATKLQLPSGTVKGRMRLGLQKLRAEMGPARA